ncbi:ubiquitin carboxyl-terminal hydrolase puf [Aricia agestis]|uniref:ubiquitin carboxyl-terminal hydrolase puf n=1 Tax=Aricia agestis TaxID=91739 RepID=UPI001C204EEA|nr:ubiquitin carboxyl-terminal hydrolase puf [Aricia agestis]
MCDVCSEFSQLLINCETRLTDDVTQYPSITQPELETVLNYILTWPQRQCMCCYRDVKNFERFYLVVQSILCSSVCQLKLLKDELVTSEKSSNEKVEQGSSSTSNNKDDNTENEPKTPSSQEEPDNESKSTKQPTSNSEYDGWHMQQKEKLMHIVSKIFLLNFPLYLACKHSALSRLDDLSAQEISNLSSYCDLHDTEIPAYLLRNVTLFCKLGGVCAMTSVFENATSSNLPLSMAHAIVAAVGNLKLWLNFRAVAQLFMPLRSKILKYMCSLEDKDLRANAVKSMADFMWGAAKEPLDAPLAFDGDGLALAFKYFNSSTLTMRLAGVAQINAHIAAHNDLCAGEPTADAEAAGQQLASWLTNNNIIEHLFGPNLHVEVIKQSHMILKFLAVEGRVTPEHIELVWAAAQLKHCGRQVYDLLPGFIRALAPKPCAHLYSLLCALPPKEHTEQSLYLASALMRAMWARGGCGAGGSPAPEPPPPRLAPPTGKPHHRSSSEASVSMDQTNSDDDPCEELSTSGEDAGPTPRKQSKHQREIILTAEQEAWLRSNDDLPKKECSALKACQKRSKRAGSSGSGSSGAEELLRPRKKKLYKKRHKGKRHLPAPIKASDLAESVSEVEEESSGSDTAHCQLLCENVDTRRLMELRLMESYKRRSEEEGSASSALSTHSAPRLPDIDDDDSACEEELARLAAQAQCLTEYGVGGGGGGGGACGGEARPPSPAPAPLPFNVDDVCRPGNTLLWDLLQDGAIEQLGEGLALEAEKALCALLCFSTDKFIRIKFIEGCLDNLANHRSVAVSLRLLPKLLSSFQQLRGMDMHQVVMWAERERGMMRLFLEDLRHYVEQRAAGVGGGASGAGGVDAQQYAHITELTVRLHFLTAIFSPVGSPQYFRLTVDQVEELWQCLVVRGTSECADCLYSWLLSHTKSPEQHALGLDALRFLYIEKMPTLDPETISIMGLSLYQQLCNLARMALGAGDSRDSAHPHTLAMDHLWKIALRANSTDVSMGAIQYLNSYYMGQQLQQEDDFVSKCMFHLSSAAERLISKNQEGEGSSTNKDALEGKDQDKPSDKQNIYEHMTEEAALQCIQRALLLLKTHLDTFKRRYAFHLRRWALAESGAWEGGATGAGSVRITLQPAGAGPRASLCLHQSDLVAHLRAHVHVWWERQIQGEEGVTSLSTDGPLRMITQGQELTIDYDERTLYDMGFKDNQLVFVSVGVGARGAWAEWPSAQPAPARARLPTHLLLDPIYFHQLFTLMQALGQMKEPGTTGEPIAHTKAQLLSRRVWDILQAVPLNPTLLEDFQNVTENKLPELLDPRSPQKLMYSLHIIDKLSLNSGSPNAKETSGSSDKTQNDEKVSAENWNELFIKKGGLRLLYDIMMSGVLQRNDDSEWRQDCLALLLQLLCRIGTLPTTELGQTPKLHPSLLSLMNVEDTTERLISILCEAATVKEPATYKTGFWGRAQVVQHAMRMCVVWARGGGGAAGALAWALRRAAPRLLLDDADPAVRREAGSALYRLCAGGEVGVLTPLLSLLLQHLPRAADMRPHAAQPMHHHEVVHHHAEEGKEPYGPACRDYFWLVCRLVDGLPEDFFKEGTISDDSDAPDLNELCEQIRSSLEKREIIEKRSEPCTPDDGLYGQLSLLTHLVKHPLRFKTSEQGTRTIDMIFGFLFDVPNPSQRNLPKCKSQKSRAAAYDLLVELVRGAPDNYMVLHHKLMEHHKPGPASCYPWDYWPAEESRSECGFAGLTNLGATCYMASCMQHLYMMPQARAAVLRADPARSRHAATLHEMQRMFAYLLESERKAYNPRSFCKVYQMDHQPLNTGEQKDMAEFFIDLVSKLEEMTPELKKLVKNLFCGVLSNNVVSLDCGHVSRTLEEFYTVRCQVADMRNLHQSLDEVTVKDTLEGDNCYTCSHCASKVRAEKRACFKKLPRILCFNTMRYTFNMLTMLKEKVNTHFSFPMRLDMSGYVEKHLMPAQYQEEKKKSAELKKDGDNGPSSPENEDDDDQEHYEYELIGVTVHTGTADGGHYYSFIRDREHAAPDRWLLFNDAEVKPFDPAHIAAECFGGEMTSKTYDSVTDKFMDFSFEKTNSAYMLFYELSPPPNKRGSDSGQQEEAQSSRAEESPSAAPERRETAVAALPADLLAWIWDDNMHFLHDKNIFQHAYFTFMGQMCSSVPQSLLTLRPEITEVAARLSTSFFIETFIHAKEKPTMVSWVELVTKQFNASAAASEWFLGHMADDTWWPMQVLIKCPNQMVRQMYQRLCMHVIQRLRSSHYNLYLQGDEGEDSSKLGEASCVTRFIRMLLSLMDSGARTHLRHLTEYFSLLYEFSKMGEEEGKFMLRVNAISSMVNFYLGQNNTIVESPTDEAGSSGSGSGGVESVGDKLRPGALDKMVALVSGLVERSRDAAGQLALGDADARALLHTKGFPFIYQQTRDCLNLQQTRSLIFALCRWNEPLAQKIVNMIFQAIAKHSESCGPFFKLLTLLVEGSGGGGGAGAGGLPCFTQLVLARLWDAADVCPHAALEWLAMQVPRNKAAHAWALRTLDRWVEPQLLGAGAARVRAAAALLLVALVPSQHFRAGYSRARPAPHPPHPAHPTHPAHPAHPAKLPDTAHHTLHQVYTMLLSKLKAARKYTEITVHGTMKLTAYFGVMSYCLVSRVEKLMFGQYFNDLWDLYHPAISEPSVAVHPNKQALLTFWHAVCVDCPENVQLAVSSPRLIKHIAFNYILADHEDGEVVAYNRSMLPPYYALLRMCCRRSAAFARGLAQHQNIHWAFRNIAPHAHLYPAAADELLRLARILAARGGNTSTSTTNDTADGREAAAFRRSTLSAYLQGLNGRTCWTTLISAFCTLVENEDDRLYVVYNGGLQMTFEALHSLHAVYVEGGGGSGAGGGAVRAELRAALRWARALCRTLRTRRDAKEARALLLACKDWPECARRLLTVLNLHARTAHLPHAALGVLRELVLIGGGAALGALVPLAAGAHAAARASARPRARPPAHSLASPPRHHLFRPYHKFIDTCCRVARSQRCMSEQLVLLSALCALEAVPLRFNYFAAFWRDVAATPADSKLEEMLLDCSVLSEYMDAILLDERECLEDPVIYEFMQHYYPKACARAAANGGGGGVTSAAGAGRALASLAEEVAGGASGAPLSTLLGAARALLLLGECAPPAAPALRRAATALQHRLLDTPEEESPIVDEEPSEAPSEPRCASADGSDDEQLEELPAEPDDSPDDEPPRARAHDLLPHLTRALHALRALHAPDAPPAQPAVAPAAAAQ